MITDDDVSDVTMEQLLPPPGTPVNLVPDSLTRRAPRFTWPFQTWQPHLYEGLDTQATAQVENLLIFNPTPLPGHGVQMQEAKRHMCATHLDLCGRIHFVLLELN